MKKKTVIFEFPNDFRFPEKWGFPQCDGCPFDISMDDEPLCFLTGDSDCWPSVYDKSKGGFVRLPHPNCPFYGGADTVNYDDYPYRPD